MNTYIYIYIQLCLWICWNQVEFSFAIVVFFAAAVAAAFLGIFQIKASFKCQHCKVFSYMQHNFFILFPFWIELILLFLHIWKLLRCFAAWHVFVHLYLLASTVTFIRRAFHLKTRTTGKHILFKAYIDSRRLQQTEIVILCSCSHSYLILDEEKKKRFALMCLWTIYYEKKILLEMII